MAGLEKAWQPFCGKPLIEHVIERLSPQVDDMVINANQQLERYQSLGLRVIGDENNERSGPLLGIYSCLIHIQTGIACVVPCDMPSLPSNLVAHLQANMDKDSRACLAHDGQRLQPLVSLLLPGVQDVISGYLSRGDRRVHECMLALPHTVAYFNDPGAFVNFNTLDQLRHAQQKP